MGDEKCESGPPSPINAITARRLRMGIQRALVKLWPVETAAVGLEREISWRGLHWGTVYGEGPKRKEAIVVWPYCF